MPKTTLALMLLLAFNATALGQTPYVIDVPGKSATLGEPVLELPTSECGEAKAPLPRPAVPPMLTVSAIQAVTEASALAVTAAAPVYLPAYPPSQDSMWLRAEYGFWWLTGTNLPPLITASPPGTPQEDAGVLGEPGTTVLAGNERVNGEVRSGFQLTVGGWLDENQALGIEASFLLIEGQGRPFGVASDGTAIIARPYTDAQTGEQAAELVSFPGLLAGSAIVNATSDPLLSGRLDLKTPLCCDCCRRINLLIGYRYLRLEEELLIQENLTSLEAITAGTNIVVTDVFHTQNEFQGGNLGIQAEYRRGRWTLDLLGRLAIGNLHREATIDGSTVVTAPGLPPVTNVGGLLALSSNIGSYDSDKVVLVPEFGITLGWQLTPLLRTTLGYTFLWWTDVARPGDQIDLVVNPSLLPPAMPMGLARPAFTLKESDLIAHGLRLGLELSY